MGNSLVDARVIQGIGSSTGVVEGRARIVLDPGAIDGLDRSEILVARETDPGWLFLMLASSGIVVERGSMLSHTAITGRQFGIPTVVGAMNATTSIREGSRVRVDGSSGLVTVLDA
ncbi:hypothetical protein LZC95_06445 [Pendulispora brunnea]|uniref:PEP-utilising enzyme mobile domain-containing protein n=1 Tax=Pendulispora brunnea TaxID=2905690 RepID=A0ABZ2KCR6_9BACT